MPECAEEKQTQHHLGAGYGFGPVQDPEYVYFAVFEETLINTDEGKLAADSFENKALKKANQSVSRASFTSRAVFEEHVVRAGDNTKGALKGVAAALVDKIRSLRSPIQMQGTEKWVRSFCVLDCVMPGDYDSHATIGFGERTKPHEDNGVKVDMSEPYIKKIRAAARMELADVFEAIKSIDQVQFANAE